MRKNRTEAILGFAMVGLACVVVILRQAWRESHRGGYPLFSFESWQHMKWWLLIGLLVFLVGVLAATIKKDGSK